MTRGYFIFAGIFLLFVFSTAIFFLWTWLSVRKKMKNDKKFSKKNK
jgi:hypothetical protein